MSNPNDTYHLNGGLLSSQTPVEYRNLNEAAKMLITCEYSIQVAYKDNFNDDHLRHNGIFTTGVREFDQVMHDQPVFLIKNIMDMFELYKKGITFFISPHSQTESIYEMISNYLNAAKFHIDSHLNARKLDLDMLLDMDSFASKIYDHAVQHFTNEWKESQLARSLTGLSIARKVQYEKAQEPDRKEWRHSSFATAFVTKLGQK